MKELNLKIIITVLSVCFIISVNYAQDFLGRYIIIKNGRPEFIQEDTYIKFHYHSNIVSKFGSTGIDHIKNAANLWANTSSLLKPQIVDPAQNIDLDDICTRQGTMGLFDSQFNLIAIDGNNIWDFNPIFEIGQQAAVCITHYSHYYEECNNGDLYYYLAPVIAESDIALNKYCPINPTCK